MLAAWPPASPMKVGHVGRFLGDHVFDQETSLGVCGIEFSVDDEPGPGVLSYTSEGVTESGVKAGTRVPDLASGAITAKAQVRIGFQREHGIIFRASGLRYQTMRDQPRMARNVARLAESGQWGRDWYVVTQVVHAASATILISDAPAAEVELSLAADAEAGGIGLPGIELPGIELFGAGLAPRVVRYTHMHVLIVDEGGLAPLFKAKRVRRTFFGDVTLKAGFGPADVSAIEDLDDTSFERELLEEADVVDAIVLGDAPGD